MRFGFTSTEMVVACSLLTAAMAVVGPMAVRTTRLWKDSRHQQLALEELTGQLERLTAMEPRERAAAMGSLSPSDALLAAAPFAEIQGETIRDQDGTRIVLTLDWHTAGMPQSPLRLVGWLDPLTTEDAP